MTMKSMITAAAVALCMAVVQRVLATEAIQVSYIESVAAKDQYLDTGYTPNANTTITAEFQALDATGGYVFGEYGNNNGRCQFQYKSPYFIGFGGSYVNTKSLAMDTDWHTIGLTNGVFYLDGTPLNEEFLWPGTGSAVSLHLFAANRSNAHQEPDVGNLRLRSFVISENGEVKCNFVPARVGDKVGLIDLAKSKFLQNKGKGEFLAGEDVGPLSVGDDIELAELTEAALTEALASAGFLSTIILPEGTLTLSKCCVINKPVTVRGSGDRATVVRTTSTTACAFKIDHSMAELKNVTIDGVRIAGNTGAWTSKAAGVELNCGTLRNATVWNCKPSDEGNVSAVFFPPHSDRQYPCLMENCTVTNNDCGTSQYAIGTVHCRNAGAVIRNCEIAWNKGQGAAGLYLYYGAAENCNIHHNEARNLSGGSGSGGGVRLDPNGSVNDGVVLKCCTIADNTAAGGGGGVWLRGGTMVNCLVANNSAALNGGGICAESDGGEAYYCNVGGNSAARSGVGIYVNLTTAGQGRNFRYNLIDQNGSDRANEVVITSGKPDFGFCAMREEVIEVCKAVKGDIWCRILTKDPFRADGSYLTVDSADYEGIDDGSSDTAAGQYVCPSVDILGRPRPIAGLRGRGGVPKKGVACDIGCCEYLYRQPGFCIFIN